MATVTGWRSGALALLLAAAALGASAAEQPHGQGVLFRIERAGLAPSHLLGTMHSTDMRVLDWPKAVTRAIDASTRMVLEVTDPRLKPEDMVKATEFMLRDGRTLLTVVGNETFARTSKVAQSYGMRRLQFGFMTPIAVVLTFMSPPRETKRIAQGWAFLDHKLRIEARALDIPIFELESRAEVAGYMTDMPEAKQVRLLEHALARHDAWLALYDDMLERYLARDLAGLKALSDALSDEVDGVVGFGWYDRLINERNRTMAGRIVEHLEAGRAFVAVGAAHVPGPNGILSLLEEKGFRVTPVY